VTGDEVLKEYELSRQAADPVLDEAMELAAGGCGAAGAALALQGPAGWWFPGRFALHADLEPGLGALGAQVLERGETCGLAAGAPGARRLTGTPVGAPGGPLLGCLAVWDDRGQDLEPARRRALELAGRQVTALLEARRRHAQARSTLLATRRELERADRLAMVGKLAAGIAHEVGTPLAVVAGRARQLAAGSVQAEQVAPAARTIAEQADRIAGIIRQLLDFARRREPRPGRFDIRNLLRQSATLVEQAAARRKVRVQVVDLPAARIVQFDGSQMMQVLTNLLMNALQATPEGGAVTLSLDEGEVTPPASTGLEARRYVVVRVADTGVGIPEENLAKVFDPFFTTKDTGEGTGLGLSVAQGIVRDHEGWIAVESQRGQGSTFSVHLPG
jgi:two-component system, NtrC family, sensor kinase